MRHLLLLVFLVLPSHIAVVVTQTSCSRSVRISSNSTCVWSNENGGGACGSLRDVLTRRRSVSEGDCVEFAFDQGVFYLPTENITIGYSTVMRAISGTAYILCDNTTNLTTPRSFSYLIQFSGAQTNVTIDSIHFDRCSGPLRFENLDHLVIMNSNFRYTINYIYVNHYN